MKTKLLILSGITLVILSGAVVAENKFFSSQTTPTETVFPADMYSSNEKSEPPLVITKDPNVLRGRGFFYAEGGTLYKEEVSVDGTLATTSQDIATGSIRLVDQSEDVVLFVKDLVIPTEGLNGYRNELWLLDKRTGVTKKLLDNVTQEGSVSPVAGLVVVRTTNNQLLVLTYDGGIVANINTYGVSPIFSPSGDKIAYIKLKDGRTEMGDPDMFQGVAVYDLATLEDTLVLKTAPDGNEWMIAGWSSDGKRVYFPSVDSTWSVGINGTGKRQETNKTAGAPRVPMFLSHLLFTDDGTLAFGEAEGLWAFNVGKDGDFLDARKVVEGTPGYSSRLDWLERGKSVSSRLYGKTTTMVYRISDLNR